MSKPSSSSKTQELLQVSAISITSGASTLDANGNQLFKWSHPLKDRSDCCGRASEACYAWCGCFALAQIESRMGIASFNSAITFPRSYLNVCVVLGSLAPWFVYTTDDKSPFYGDSLPTRSIDVTRLWLWPAAVVIVAGVFTGLWLRRSAKALPDPGLREGGLQRRVLPVDAHDAPDGAPSQLRGHWHVRTREHAARVRVVKAEAL